METKPTALLIPAAGQASRMGKNRNKQYILIAGKPVLAHTLQAFLGLGLFSPVFVLVTPGEEALFRKWVLSPFFPQEKDLFVFAGGKERQDTVSIGLTRLQQMDFPGNGYVCVHDGARPLVTPGLIRSVCQEAFDFGAAICGIPLNDTVKTVGDDGLVLSTPSRNALVAVQTPQCFLFSLLLDAHNQARSSQFLGSDEAVLLEKMGIPVKVIAGDEENIKLTTPQDLLLAELLFKARHISFPKNEMDEDFDCGWRPGCR